MDIREMHYDFKKKLNKVDSQQYRNLLVPEIDWSLNEAQEIYVRRAIAAGGGMEGIRTLVVRGFSIIVAYFGDAVLPTDFWHFLRGEAKMLREKCSATARLFLRGQGDDFERDPYRRSSFGWREVNCTVAGDRLHLYNDGTFISNNAVLDYVRRPKQMHAAADHRGGSYKMPGGAMLSGTADCELPEECHRAIVDLAVLCASGEMESPGYPIKKEKVSLSLAGD